MKIRKGDELELTIESIAFKGKGVAKVKAGEKPFTVFVSGVVVGDVVRARVFKLKKRWAEAQLLEVVNPSPRRIEARCKHFETCGGCTFQNITYQNQLTTKKQFVVDSFERLGGFEKPPIQDVLASPEQWFYRNKMELSFGLTDKGWFGLGFHVPRRRYDIFRLEECFLESEILGEMAKKVQDFFEKNKVKAVDSRNEGTLFTLTVREGKNTGERMIILTTSKGPFDWMDEFVYMLQDNFEKEITSFYWIERIIKKGSPTQLIEHHQYGEDLLHEKLKLDDQEFTFSIEPQAFFQPNSLGAELLYSEVLKQIGEHPDEICFDLFCGTGTIGIVLAHRFAKVIGVELNASAVKSAERNALLNGITNIEFIVGDVGKTIHKLEEKPSTLVLDPPRAGLMPQAMEDLIELKPSKIVYVSCNPSTLARDCQLFCEAGYELKNVQPVDMFPQTYHVENVALLTYNALNNSSI